MQKQQTIALMGATGKAGQYILNCLLENGYRVKCLVRNPDGFTVYNNKLTIIKGDANDALAIETLLSDCTALISALGQRQGEPLIAATATRHIIAGMQRNNIKRYIFLSGLNLDVPGDLKSPSTEAKSAWMRQHYPEAVADKQLAYQLVAESNLHWTMVRLPMLEQTAERFKVKVNLYDSPGETISAADLADFLISQINDEAYYCKAPFVAN